jgi:hypothetical protein
MAELLLAFISLVFVESKDVSHHLIALFLNLAALLEILVLVTPSLGNTFFT